MATGGAFGGNRGLQPVHYEKRLCLLQDLYTCQPVSLLPRNGAFVVRIAGVAYSPGHIEDCYRPKWCEEDSLSKLCEEGEVREAVEALGLLVQRGCHIKYPLFYRVLKKCTSEKDLVLGRRVHGLLQRSGLESIAFLANHLIVMYASHGRLEDATKVFNKVVEADCCMWASIILAHVRHGQATKAIQLYKHMRELSVKADNHIYHAVLKACASATDLSSGKEVHADILRNTVQFNLFVGNGLVDMYAKCGSLEDARKVFDQLLVRDVVTWTAMIAGYAQHGHPAVSIELYRKMRDSTVRPDSHLYVAILGACASAADLDSGKEVHSDILCSGDPLNVFIGNGLVNMYSKCGSLEDARRVFDILPYKDVVSWNAMISGYSQHGLGQEALTLWSSMEQAGVALASYVTFVCLLQACASVGALQQGRKLHAQIKERELERDAVVGNGLLDMYAKCGSLGEARRVFDSLLVRDVVTWNALINGYGQCHEGQMALRCFEEMQEHGVEPDDATFVSVLVACSHGGLVNEGLRYFRIMVHKHGIMPNVLHCNCLVDLFGRSGWLDEAESLLQSMPVAKEIAGWMALLTACKIYGDIERARRCFDHVIKLKPAYSGAYILLGNIYATAGRWNDVEEIESLRKSAGAKKKAAKAFIEVQNNVHVFTVGEDRTDISSKSRHMNSRVKEEGSHVPQRELVWKYASDSQKEDALCGHAEKLALAYGLLNTPDGTTLLVTKNLRMCNDCHSATKILSRVEQRDIILRDAHRVHRFVGGSCSCGDRH